MIKDNVGSVIQTEKMDNMDSIITFIIDSTLKELNGKLILDNDFVDLCNQSWTDLKDCFLSAIGNHDNFDEDATVWASKLFTLQLWRALSTLIDYKNIRTIYGTFDVEVDDSDEVDEELIPTYIVCGILTELDGVEVVANKEITALMNQYQES